MNFGFQIAQQFLRKTSFDFEIWVTFHQGQRMALTFDTQSTSFTHLVEFFQATLIPKAAIVSKKKYFPLFPIQKPM